MVATSARKCCHHDSSARSAAVNSVNCGILVCMRTKQAATRRMGVESSATRIQLIDEAAKLLKKEGCGAVTARRLAEKLGLKRQIVHYYFATIEDLLIAVIKRDSEAFHEHFTQELIQRDPLHVIWELGNEVP